jgi:hypothetical protein
LEDAFLGQFVPVNCIHQGMHHSRDSSFKGLIV